MATFEEYSLRVGMRIRALRAQAGLSLRTFGMMIGVHYNHILNIEQGAANPTLQTLYRIAQGLDVPVTRLLDDADEGRTYWFTLTQGGGDGTRDENERGAAS